MRLTGKRVLITGTAGGQGQEAQALFAREGAHVVGCDIQVDAAAACAEVLRAESLEVHGMTVDLTDGRAAAAWVDDAAELLGGIDVLYNNAAGYQLQRFAEMSLETWQKTIRSELDIVYHTTRQAWAYLAENGGSVINTASLAGLRGLRNQAAHAAAKGGVVAFTRGLAVEGGPAGIRANAITPGPIDTQAARNVLSDADRAWLVSRLLIQRLGTAADIAACALFLASDEATWVTGQNFIVDGGLSAGLQ